MHKRWGLGLLAGMAAASVGAAVPALPNVTGPVPDPDPVLGPMFAGLRPSLTPGHQLSDFQYVTEEYWISGMGCSVPYKTRIVVRRPADPARFSGVVVAEPLHRGGNALIFNFSRFGLMQRGHIGVEIDARSINLNNANNPLQSLQPFNPTRYGAVGNTNVSTGFVLAPNNAGQANEVLAQVGRLIKSNVAANPLRQWGVQRVVMAGTSDASEVVRQYLAGATGAGCDGTLGHASLRMPDGGPVFDGFFRGSILNRVPTPALADVPHIEMPTQFELHSSNGFRKPDSDAADNRYRLYEVSGMAHNDSRDNAGFDPRFPGGQQCDPVMSRFHFPAFYFLGLQHVIDWTYGRTPPVAPSRMGVDDNLAGDGTRVATDALGNATGGVRSTYLDVPLFRYRTPGTGPGSLCSQIAQQFRFDDETARRLHLNPRHYADKWKQRLGQLLDEGWVPPEYADEVRADAREYWDNGPEAVFWRRGRELAVWRLDGERLVASGVLPAVPPGWDIAARGDLDGDGQLDLVLHHARGDVAVWLVQGTGLKAQLALPTVRPGARLVGSGDVDGDGFADLVWQLPGQGLSVQRIRPGGAPGAVALPPAAPGWRLAGVGDVDGDGRADLLHAGPDGQLAVWRLDDSGAARSEPVVARLPRGTTVLALADVTGDGRADLLLQHAGGGLSLWAMRGAQVTSDRPLPTLPGGWRLSAQGDFDRDGREDLVWQAADGRNVVWFMGATGVLRSAYTASSEPGWSPAQP
ncbi:VCBS repeat-containing protein [Aquabacterium sp. J223]|uniref:VCBS repeat-containing protein n=1 Tax=Aquabacterium sp. J223 TaxID=2898431 RepID=UPI0021ADA0D1|nr:VCBS repeat-containing protein [Aquabacterium sp. J223]UUX95002.1 VCBS repeat-containing protein [Aquabacterium sp. J223]